MKKFLFVLLIIVLLGLAYGAKYLIDRSPIFTGYAAKEVCSCMFVNGRTLESVQNEDINFSLIPLSTIEVDEENMTVSTSFLGLGKQKAIFRKGLGCVLLAGGDEEKASAMTSEVAISPDNPEAHYWPYGDMLYDTILPNVDYHALNIAIDSAVAKANTRAVVILYDTLMMWDKYANGFTKDTRILGWSMTKSIMSAMVGMRVKDGVLDIHKPAPVVEWKDDERSKITLDHLLKMNSGLQWTEDYGDISEATVMLYNSSDVGSYAISQPLIVEPGTEWLYSSGSSNIIAEILKRSFDSHQDYLDYPRKELFNKLGMRSAILETDAVGTFIGSSYTQATPRDYGRFGLLYLKDGIWKGERVFPKGWVDYSVEESAGSDGDYGAQWWLNKGGAELPDCPKDIYFMDGFNGQRVYIVPSKKLVIVRMGLSKKGEFDYNEFVMSIIAAFE